MHSSLYQKASEALIGLENIEKLKSMTYNAPTRRKDNSKFIELASLSAMRKDQHMANYWLMEAKKIDSENELYIQCRELLFPEGKARDKMHHLHKADEEIRTLDLPWQEMLYH